ncbi:hypothetical protein V2J09_011043, partial [Rumex salicifolius]
VSILFEAILPLCGCFLGWIHPFFELLVSSRSDFIFVLTNPVSTGDGSTTTKESIFSRTNNSSRAEIRSTQEGSLPAVSCIMLMPQHPVPLAKKVVAEFIGTFIIIFAGTEAAKTQSSETLIGLAASGGLAVMIVILSTGHISGACIRRSTAAGLFLCSIFNQGNFPPHLRWGRHCAYRTQLCPSFRSSVYHHLHPHVCCDCSRRAGKDRCRGNCYAQYTHTRPATGASMNPARTLGPAVAANIFKAIWIYVIAPILGALCGAGVYTAVKLPEEDDNYQMQPSAIPSIRR